MKVALRLVFTLAFVGFVLPKLIPGLNLGSTPSAQDHVAKFENTHSTAATERFKEFTAEVDAMDISDNGLKFCLVKELEVYAKMGPKSSGSIRSVRQLKSLRCDGRRIRNLDGIDGLRNLRNLSLVDNNIKSLAPLRFHARLESIDLSKNDRIKSLQPLQTLGRLRSVTFPRMDSGDCETARAISEHMESEYGRKAYSNLKSVCR